MKRSLVLVLLLLLFPFLFVYPQTVPEQQTLVLIQGFNNGMLNSRGSSGIVNDIENIYSLNPSSLSNFNGLSLGLAYQTFSDIKEAYIAGIGYSRIKNNYPQTFGFAYSFDNFKIGLGFGQSYNARMDIGEIPITTVENPDGTGHTFTPVFESTVFSYGITLSYSLQDIIENGDEINLGIRLNRNVLDYYEKLDQVSIEGKVFCYNAAVGIGYYFNLDQNRKLGFGLFYESGISFSKRVEPNYDNYTNPVQPNDTYYRIVASSFALTGKIPSKLVLDSYYELNNEFGFLAGTSLIFWNSSNDGLSNQLNFTGSVIYTPINLINLSVGFYNSTRSYKDDSINRLFRIDENIDALFLTAGVKINYSHFHLNLSLADSHLFSDSWREQTIIKFGLGYGL